MGRRRKEIDPGIIFHMLLNKAPIAAVAKHCKCHPDTIFANFGDIIREARQAHYKAWQAIHWPLLEEKIKQREEKRKAKMVKKKYNRGIYRYR